MGSTERKRNQSAHQPTGQWIRADLRLSIYLRDRFRCLACNIDLTRQPAAWLTLDHIRPKEAGGSNRPDNLVTSCKSCNCSRRNAPMEAVVDRATLGRIRRQVKIPIGPYRRLARALIGGLTGP
jgi:5-methylcytosine-specific restriction endonuclease McrA